MRFSIQVAVCRWFAAICLSFAGAIITQAADDFGSWQAVSLRILDNDRWVLTSAGQLRFRDNNSQLFAYYLSQQAVFKVSPSLRLGLNYTYLPAKPSGSSTFSDQKRWEFEVNLRRPVNDALTFDLRNRYELRWLEGRSGTNERSRHRPQITLRLKDAGALQSVFANNEIFYDYATHRRTENRLVPVGLSFRTGEKTAIRVYYMIRSVRGPTDWSQSHVLGTQVSYAL